MQINNTNNDTYAPSYSSSYTKVSTAGAGAGADGSIQAGGGNQASNNTIPPLEPKGSFPDAAPRNNEVFGLRDGIGNKYTGVGEGGYTPLPTPQVPSNVLVPPNPNYPSVSHFPRPEDTNPGDPNKVSGADGTVIDLNGTVGQEFDGLVTVQGGQPPQSLQPPQSGQENNHHPNNVGFLPPANPPRQYFQFQENYVQPVQVWHTQPSVNYYPEKNEVTAYVKDGKVIDFADLYIPKDGKYSPSQSNFINAYNKYINTNG